MFLHDLILYLEQPIKKVFSQFSLDRWIHLDLKCLSNLPKLTQVANGWAETWTWATLAPEPLPITIFSCLPTIVIRADPGFGEPGAYILGDLHKEIYIYIWKENSNTALEVVQASEGDWSLSIISFTVNTLLIMVKLLLPIMLIWRIIIIFPVRIYENLVGLRF